MNGTAKAGDNLNQPETPINADRRGEMLAEYAALRSEIIDRMGMRHQILALSIVILGAILTFSKDVTSIVLLAYPFLSAFLAIGWSHADFRIAEIAQYIRKELEPKLPGLQWEAYISKRRQKKSIGRFFRPAELSANGVFIGTAALAVGLAAPKLVYSTQEIALLALDGLAIAVTFLVIRRRRRWHSKDN